MNSSLKFELIFIIRSVFLGMNATRSELLSHVRTELCISCCIMIFLTYVLWQYVSQPRSSLYTCTRICWINHQLEIIYNVECERPVYIA